MLQTKGLVAILGNEVALVRAVSLPLNAVSFQFRSVSFPLKAGACARQNLVSDLGVPHPVAAARAWQPLDGLGGACHQGRSVGDAWPVLE